MIKIIIYLTSSALIVTLAITVPISYKDGLNNLNNNELVFAKDALSAVDGHLDNPFQKIYTISKKIIKVEKSNENCGYQAIIQTYTFFGIRLSKLKVTCNGIVTM